MVKKEGRRKGWEKERKGEGMRVSGLAPAALPSHPDAAGTGWATAGIVVLWPYRKTEEGMRVSERQKKV